MAKRDELKNRVEELFTGGGSLSSSDTESMFKAAFDNLAVGMCFTELNGSFLLVNKAFASMVGYTPDEMAGQNFQALTYSEDVHIGGDALRAMLSGQADFTKIQKRYVHKDGSLIWVELNITLLHDQTGKPERFFTIIQDIGEQRSTALLLEKRVLELNCLNDIGHKIDEQPSMEEFLDWVCGRIPAAMLYPEECVVAIELDGKIYGNPTARDLTSKVVGGIRVAGELLGWLHIAYSQPRSFIDAESALVGGIVSRLSGYIQTLRQQQESDRRAKELTILNEMALALTSVLELDAVVETVYEYTKKLTDVRNFFLALYDDESQMISFPIAFSDGERTQINSRPLGNALTDYIIRHGEPLLLSDRVLERAVSYGIQLVLYGKPVPAESWLGVPIIHANKVQGVICVQSITTPGMFKEYDREMLTNIARSAANALALTRQYQQLQLAVDRLRSNVQHQQALREITTRVRGLMEPDVIMRTAVRELGAALGRKTYILLGGGAAGLGQEDGGVSGQALKEIESNEK